MKQTFILKFDSDKEIEVGQIALPIMNAIGVERINIDRVGVCPKCRGKADGITQIYALEFTGSRSQIFFESLADAQAVKSQYGAAGAPRLVVIDVVSSKKLDAKG